MAEKTFLPVFAVLSLLVFICPLHSGVLETDTLERDYEPVVVEGGMMPGISGGQIPLEQIYAYAYRENQWRQVVRIRSGEPTGYLGLAECLIGDNQFDQADKVLQTVLRRSWPKRFGRADERANVLRRQLEAKRTR